MWHEKEGTFLAVTTMRPFAKPPATVGSQHRKLGDQLDRSCQKFGVSNHHFGIPKYELFHANVYFSITNHTLVNQFLL